MNTVTQNLLRIRERIDAAARRAGRDPSEITLSAVSKRQPLDLVREAYAAGQRVFAENYAQHLRDRSSELENLGDIRWHFIGHLQKNKIKYVLAADAVVETVDSIALADELNRAASKRPGGRPIDCFVQVNVGREAQKSGIAPEETGRLLDAVESAAHLRLTGLMTIPPWGAEPDESRKYFSALREIRDIHGGPGRLPHLSMGMSGDFEQAIEEGATVVRVGTAIFGLRD